MTAIEGERPTMCWLNEVDKCNDSFKCQTRKTREILFKVKSVYRVDLWGRAACELENWKTAWRTNRMVFRPNRNGEDQRERTLKRRPGWSVDDALNCFSIARPGLFVAVFSLTAQRKRMKTAAWWSGRDRVKWKRCESWYGCFWVKEHRWS